MAREPETGFDGERARSRLVQVALAIRILEKIEGVKIA